MGLIKSLLKYFAFKKGKLTRLYLKINNPGNAEYADYIRARGFLYHLGEGTVINRGAIFTDPKYFSIGNNCCLSNCSLIGHDASVAVFAVSTGKILDKVGPIIIGNNCFIGQGAIILPDVTIGDNCIVAAGAVVNENVESGTIVGGVPAKFIGKTNDYISKIENQTLQYPWYDLISKRNDEEDYYSLEDELVKQRVRYFFKDK